jgi:LPS-assembly protein
MLYASPLRAADDSSGIVVVPETAAASPAATADRPPGPAQQEPSQSPKPADAITAAADDPQKVVLNADRVSYDDEQHTVTARGNVQLAQGEQVVTADVITYNQDLDRIIATGNVIMKETGGSIFFGDYLELNDQMKNGFLNQARVLLIGDARVTATAAARREGRYMDMDHATYSPCVLCKDDPTQPPVWQMKATQVTHDAEDKELYYYDTTLEIDGVPIFYSPYFAGPDPTVKQRSGLLSSTVGERSNLGFVNRNYYYYGISPDEDATVEATYASQQGPLLGGEWRDRFDYGKLILSGSLAEGKEPNNLGENTDGPQVVRGHIFGLGIYDLSDDWRTGFNLARTSDKNFLETYSYSDQDVLDNRAYVEGFFDRDYAVANIYSAQDLRGGETSVQPVSLPYATYQAFGDQAATFGGRWSFTGGVLGLARTAGQNTGRVNSDEGWQRTILAGGLSTNVDAHLLGDAYVTNNKPLFNDTTTVDNGGTASGRLLPQFHTVSTLPLVNPTESGSWLIEPTGSFAFAPRGLARNNKVPNEDSTDLEFDTTNLFDANRFPGTDRVEDGVNLAYGVKTGYSSNNGGYAYVFLGQNHRIGGDDIFPTNSGLDTAASDYVGSVTLYPGQYITASYQTRLDHENFSSKLHQLNFSLTPSSGTVVGANYLFLASTPSIAAGQNRNNLSPFISQKLTEFWTVSGSLVTQLGSKSQIQDAAGSITYQDDCFAFSLQASKNLMLSGLQSSSSGTSVFFRLGFKTLGFFQSPNVGG